MSKLKYRTEIVGTLKFPKLVTVKDEEGNPVEVNDTAGIETTHTLEAETHLEAKKAFKEWVAQKVDERGAVGFTGTVSAYVIEETMLLDKEPFEVEVEVTKNIVVDF